MRTRMLRTAAAALLVTGLATANGCADEDSWSVDAGNDPGDVDTDSDADSDTPGDGLLDCSGVWSTEGAWGADGDLGGGGGGGGSPYKGQNPWSCLICDDPKRPAFAPREDDFNAALADAWKRREGEDGRRELVPLDDDTPEVLFVSGDDSNSQSAPVAVRQLILSGDTVPGDMLRVWEFLNYYGFSYDPPLGGKAIAVTAQLRPYDVDEGIFALQLGLQGKLVDAVRRALNITWSVDTSGSMTGESLSLAKESMRAMAAHFRAGDRVSMVSWSTVQNVPLDSHVVSGPNDATVLAAIDSLVAGGSTDLQSGLSAAYSLANANFLDGGMNRVVLLSDGGANVGVTDADMIAQEAAGGEAVAIYLVGVGVGSSYTYNDELMDTVTDLGKGASVFIDSAAEAHRAFETNFLANIEMIAHDVQIQLTLPPSFDMYEFLGEEYSENPEDVEPQNLGPNDAMIVQQLIKTTHPGSVPASAQIGLSVSWTDSFTGLADSAEGAWTLQELIDSNADQLRKGDAVVVYVQTLGRIWEAVSAGTTEEALAAVAVECDFGLSVLDEDIEVLGDADLFDLRSLLSYYCEGLLD